MHHKRPQDLLYAMIRFSRVATTKVEHNSKNGNWHKRYFSFYHRKLWHGLRANPCTQTYTYMIVVVDGDNNTSTANSGEQKSRRPRIWVALHLYFFYHTKQPWKHASTHINMHFIHARFYRHTVYIECFVKSLHCLWISVTKSDKIIKIDIYTMWIFSTKYSCSLLA